MKFILILCQYEQQLNYKMYDIYFSVLAEWSQGDKIKIIGSEAELGAWNPEKALQLVFTKGFWKGQAVHIPYGQKFQFKIIKIKNDQSIVWQVLPNNSNRKYKPKSHSQLHLKWSSAEGKVTPITKGSYKLVNLPGVLINKGKLNEALKNVKKEEEFDPYRTARDEQSDESGDDELQQFEIIRRKMSDEIGINSCDFHDIYYSNSNLQTICGLLKKIKIYVISKGFDVNIPLHKEIEEELMKLPNNYLARWITVDYFLGKHSNNFNLKLRKRASLFDIQKEEMKLPSLSNLYNRNSFFIVLELETAIALKQSISKTPTCLILQSDQYEQTIKELPNLNTISLISFDEQKTNTQFYHYLKSKSEKQDYNEMGLNRPSIESIIKELQRYNEIEPFVVNTLVNISESQSIKIFSQENIICLLDSTIIQQSPEFTNDLINNLSKTSILIILNYDQTREEIFQYKHIKNIVITYDNFEKIILDEKEYNPLREFQEIIDLIRMKCKLYLEKYGGELIEKENSIVYNLPLSCEDAAAKIQAQCNVVAKKYEFIKINRKFSRIKISWSLAKQIRLIRTMCQIKYANYGPLGKINIIGDLKKIKQLKEDLSLLVQHKQKLFKERQKTKITYYTFNDNEQSSYTIIPQGSIVINKI